MACDRRNHHRYHLPEDLINEILLRLPVKSLLRSKSVCKSWYLLIKSPEFTNNHFHHSNNHGGLLVHRYIKDLSKRAFEFFPDKSLGLSCLDPYMQDAAPVDKILGPLNGIFLLFNHPDRSALWNPATRELKPLPPVPPSISLLPDFEHFRHSFGLGLDPLTNSYKVIWIIWRIIWNTPWVERDEPIFPLVYTRGNDSWRKLQLEGNMLNFANYDAYQSLCYTYLDGVYYWRVDVYNSRPVGFYTAILSFNMEDEVFREIQAPYIQCPDNTEFSDPNLALYKDRLAMFLYNHGDPEISAETMSIEIWVMETVGCWSKQLTIGPFSQVERVCGFWNNNEVFLETHHTSELILCDPTRNQEMREIGPRRRGYLVLVLSYKESLFSIMG